MNEKLLELVKKFNELKNISIKNTKNTKIEYNEILSIFQTTLLLDYYINLHFPGNDFNENGCVLIDGLTEDSEESVFIDKLSFEDSLDHYLYLLKHLNNVIEKIIINHTLNLKNIQEILIEEFNKKNKDIKNLNFEYFYNNIKKYIVLFEENNNQ